MLVTRVELDEFETEDGAIHPINPPLEQVPTLEDFQKCYDYSAAFIRSSQEIGGNPSND